MESDPSIFNNNEVPKRILRYLELAKKVATGSTIGNFRHGAVVVSGGSAILGMGANNEKYCSFAAKYRPKDKGLATFHAEIKSIIGVDRDILKGSTIFVARTSKCGNSRMSKPCPMCHAALKAQGIKKVYYTIDETTIGFYKF